MKKIVRQRGITLLEVLGAVAIGAILLVGLTNMADTSLDDVKGQITSLYQSQVVTAATQYVNANYSTLLTSATATTPVVVSLSQLTTPTSGAPYLAPNTAATNAYGQTSCVLILQPASGQLNALVVSYGGQSISDGEISLVAANSGAGGGYISNAAPTVAQGPSWSLNAASLASFDTAPCLSGTASDGGHLASAIFFNGPGQLSTDFLYRSAVPGRPELNTMQTPILFDGSAIIADNDACGTAAAIAFDGARNLMICSAEGQWVPVTYWKNPIDTYADLPTTDLPGSVRLTTDVNRAFAYNGTVWVALAVDQNGNLTVPNNLDVQNGNITADAGNIAVSNGNITVAKGNIATTVGDINAGHDIHVTNEAWVYSTIFAEGSVAATSVNGMDVETAGSKCNIPTGTVDPDSGFSVVINPVGSIVQDANGVLLTCYSDSTFRYQNATDTP